jgi:hypothetical protein
MLGPIRASNLHEGALVASARGQHRVVRNMLKLAPAQDPQSDPRWVARLRRLAATISMTVCIISVIVFLGWGFDIVSFKSILPGWPSMKLTTALGFSLAGPALWFLQGGSIAEPWAESRFIGRACAILLVLLGLLTLGGYSLHGHYAIGQWWSRQAFASSGTSWPIRLEPLAALAFTLLGIAFLLLDAEVGHGFRPAQFLSVLAALIGLLFSTPLRLCLRTHRRSAMRSRKS